MKIYSEKTNKEYKSVDECMAAEKEYDEKVAAEKEKKLQLANQRADRAKEVEAAYDAALEAFKTYHDLLNQFCKDYGSYHKSYFGDGKDRDFFTSIWDLFLQLILGKRE